MRQKSEALQFIVFPSKLGWGGLSASQRAIHQITLGYASPQAAMAAVCAHQDLAIIEDGAWDGLIARLQDFAAGKPMDFQDVPLDLTHLAPFQREVVRHCRAIPYSQTRSYGDLAALAGSPRAARAAGTTMAQNRFALVVPCHRVINANGSLGSYGGPQGVRMKQKLLELEQRGLARFGPPKRTRRGQPELPPPLARKNRTVSR